MHPLPEGQGGTVGSRSRDDRGEREERLSIVPAVGDPAEHLFRNRPADEGRGGYDPGSAATTLDAVASIRAMRSARRTHARKIVEVNAEAQKRPRIRP